MKRKIEQKLINWKNNPNRMPLIVNGARQIGKTYSILEFGLKNYQNVLSEIELQTVPTLAFNTAQRRRCAERRRRHTKYQYK
ncbi:MAG: hypothetical protein LBK58_13550 [Prevotellaceae bacterium]|jgi:predicted AAA+ superfamily ATPase|nr:hypothetical protein [Prevotellaceae bacterium]